MQVWWHRWRWLNGRSVAKGATWHFVRAFPSVPSTESTLLHLIPIRSPLVSSFLARKIAMEISQVMCSRSYIHLLRQWSKDWTLMVSLENLGS